MTYGFRKTSIFKDQVTKFIDDVGCQFLDKHYILIYYHFLISLHHITYGFEFNCIDVINVIAKI